MTTQNQLNIILTFTADNNISVNHVDINGEVVYAFVGKSTDEVIYYTAYSILPLDYIIYETN